MSIKRVKIFDMDGTIVCSLHRYRTVKNDDGTERIDLKYWRDNEHRALDDSLLPTAEIYKEALRDEETYVIIATARVLHAPDREFIAKVLGEPDYIISRPADSFKSGAQLKIEGLRKFFNLKNFRDAEFMFFEDNITYLKKVCDEFNIVGVYVPSNQGH